MTLQIIGSSSDGNAYILTSESGCSLSIELGVDFRKIKKALDFNLSNYSAIVSHCHLDHSKGIKKAIEAGINVWSSKECFDDLEIKSYRAKTMEAEKTYAVGEFKVKPFDVVHDVRCFGFLIFHQEMGTTVFVTDTMYVSKKFKGLNNVIVETNYSKEILYTTDDHGALKNRILQSHLSFENALEMLKANDLTEVNNIVLIHLSDRNSDAARFKAETESLTGKNVHIAASGLKIPFNQYPF